MSKLRSVSTAFWSDPFVEELTPTEKLLFLYLVTNEKTNMLGIYEASISKMSFETGIDKKTLSKALERFETVGKVKYINNFVFLTNYIKHQNFNPNMKKSAIDVFNNLPKGLVDNDLEISKINPSEGFERLSKALGMVRKVEVEKEVEVEDEIETKKEQRTGNIDTERYQLFISKWNAIKGTKYKGSKNDINNFKFWLDTYSPAEIIKAIENHDDTFWAESINPQWLFRTKDTKGQPVDYIGQLLNHKPKNKMI